MDQMHLLAKARYLLGDVPKRIANIKPVKIDFPLPDYTEGVNNRLNKDTSYLLPAELLRKHQPVHIVGNKLRLSYLLVHYADFMDKIVSVVGWAKKTKLQAKDTILFVHLVDGSNQVPVQIVVENTLPNWQELKKAKMSYSFRFKGRVTKSQGKGQAFQIKVTGAEGEVAEIYGKCDDDKYPLAGDKINVETLRNLAHLRPRTQLMAAINRIKNNIAYATHVFFQNNGFIYVQTPLITGADCEGAGQMFQVTTIMPKSQLIADIPSVDGKIDYTKDFFKKITNLTVSGQLAVENFCCALSNVYTFGPTFRAEVSHTSRHVAEFWMIEPELAFADIFDTIDCAEAYVQFCIRFVLENNRADLLYFEKKKPGHLKYLENLVEGPFAKVSYTQAIDILKKVTAKGVVFEKQVEWGMDLGSQHERYLCEHIYHKPVVLYNYPNDIKAFYMRANDDQKTVASFDILAPQVGEIVGGSQREERLQVLQRRIEQKKLQKKDYWWYLDLRRHGTVPHGGFGLGFERLVMMATATENIREISCFPRTPGNAEF